MRGGGWDGRREKKQKGKSTLKALMPTYQGRDHSWPSFAERLHSLKHIYHFFCVSAFQEVEQCAKYSCLLRSISRKERKGFKNSTFYGESDMG